MKTLLLFAIISFMTLFIQGQEIKPHCEFNHQLLNYQCNFTINNIFGHDSFEYIAGNHLPNMSDDDVTSLNADQQFTATFPSIICERFRNLRDITFTASHLEILTPKTFQNCRHLRTLIIFSNLIRDLPQNVFNFNRNLRLVNLEKNLLTKIDSQSFGAAINSIDSFFVSFNHIEAIDEKFYDEATRLMTFWAEGNECVNQNFFIWNSNRHQVRRQLRECFERFVEQPNDGSYIRCNLEDTGIVSPRGSVCELEIYNPNGRDDWITVEGNFTSSITVENITTIGMLFQNTPIIPRILCNFFPNLYEIASAFSNLNNLASSSIANCTKLVFFAAFGEQIREIPEDLFAVHTDLLMVYFDNNLIEEIPARLFANTPRITIISFSNNQIKKLPPEVFSNLQFLIELRLINNELTTINSNAFTSTLNLWDVHLQQNDISSIDPNWFDSQQDLNELRLANNVCIDQNFFIIRTNRETARNALQSCFNNFDDGAFIKCDYLLLRSLSCEMNIFNPNGRDGFTEIEGQLPTGQTYEQVLSVIATNQNSSNIPAIICHQFSGLESLRFQFSFVRDINENSFANCHNLTTLYLAFNDIRTVPASTFKHLNKLMSLDLGYNFIQRISSDSFIGLTHLQSLLMDFNEIQEIPHGTFNELENVQRIDFGFNSLTQIDSRSFGNIMRTKIEFLAERNLINAIDPNWFDSTESLNMLSLSNNLCIDQNFNNIQNNRQIVRNQLQNCFDNFDGEEVTTIVPDGAFIRCTYNFWSPALDEISCLMSINNVNGRNDFDRIEGVFLPGTNYSQVVDVSMRNQMTTNIPSIICHSFPHLRYMYIWASGVTTITYETFEACNYLEEILLEFNRITHFGDNSFGNNLKNLRLIDVTRNNLQEISIRSFSTEALASLSIFDAANNAIHAIDPQWFDAVTNLTRLDLFVNLCVSQTFDNVQNNRDPVRLQLYTCFNNYVNNIPPSPDGSYIRCNYILIWEFEVHCQLFIQNPNGRNDFTEIQGTLPTNTNYSHVSRVFASEQLTTNIPSIICRQFSYVEWFIIDTSRVTTIGSESFDGCNNLRLLILIANSISHIPDNTFGSHLRNLGIINIAFNQLQEISSRSFSTEVLSNLLQFSVQNNAINAIDPDWFNSAAIISTLEMNNNLCVSQNFENVQTNRQQVGNALATCFNNYEMHQTTSTPATTLIPTTTTTISPINPYIRCTYQFLTSVDVACIMSIFNPQENSEFERIEGNFPPIANHNQLTYIWVIEQYTINIPSIICQQFPRVLFLDIYASRLRTINENSFANCNNLQYILLASNEITTIPDNTFGSNLRNIYSINLGDNQIERISLRSFSTEVLSKVNEFQADSNVINAIDVNWFDTATNITRLYLNGNLCVNMNFNDVHLNRQLVRNALNTCFNNYNFIEN